MSIPDKPGIEIVEVRVPRTGDEPVVEIEYREAEYPGVRLGAAWRIPPWMMEEASRLQEFDAEWLASHIRIFFYEEVWTGGDPRRRPRDETGTHWCRDVLA